MKRFSKIITVVLSIALILSALVVLSAANTVPTLGAANVVYGDQLTLVFTVENAAGEAGIVVYGTEDAANDDYIYSTFAEKTEGGVTFYETFKVDAKDIGKTYWVAPVSKADDGTLTFGVRTAYSVESYLNARLADENISDAQRDLYNKIKAYGAAAAAVLGK